MLLHAPNSFPSLHWQYKRRNPDSGFADQDWLAPYNPGLWDREKYDFNRRDKKLILLKNLNIDDIPITDKISITITEKNNNDKKRFSHIDYDEDTIYRMLKYTLMKLSTM